MAFFSGIRSLFGVVRRALFERPKDAQVFCEGDALEKLSQICRDTSVDDYFFVSKGTQESLGIGGNPSVLTVQHITADGREFVLGGNATEDRAARVIKTFFAGDGSLLFVDEWDDV